MLRLNLFLVVTVCFHFVSRSVLAGQNDNASNGPDHLSTAAAPLQVADQSVTHAARSMVIARVNGEPVTRAQFDRMVANPLTLRQAQKEFGIDEPQRRDLETLAMRKLIHLRLFEQEAARRKLTITQDSLDDAVTSLRRRFGSLEEFGAWIKDQGLDDPTLFETVRTDLLSDRVTAMLVDGVKVTEQETQEYFDKHRSELITGAEVRLRIIAVKDQSAAHEIIAAVRRGEPFDRLARQRSIGMLAARGGDTGWVDTQQLPSPVREIAATLKVNEVSEPVERGPGELLIIAVQGRRPKRAETFAEVQMEIERRLIPAKKQQAIQRWLKERETKSEIEILLHVPSPVGREDG